MTGRRSILACLGVLAALAGPPAWTQTWPSPTDLRDFALAEAHEAKLDARVHRHRLSPGKWLSTAAIEDTLAASQFRSIARAAKIGRARKIRIALRVWKPELYAAWRACEEGRGRGPRVPVSSYSTPMLGRPYPTSSPNGQPRGRQRPASALSPGGPTSADAPPKQYRPQASMSRRSCSRRSPLSAGGLASQPRPAWRYESCSVNDLSREISYVRDPRFLSRRTFSLADAQVPHRCLGTEERCSVISHGSGCCPHDCAPAAFWTGKH